MKAGQISPLWYYQRFTSLYPPAAKSTKRAAIARKKLVCNARTYLGLEFERVHYLNFVEDKVLVVCVQISSILLIVVK